MNRLFISAAFVLTSLVSFAQHTYYAAAKAGLSLRDQPSTNAKVLEKITYGEKLVTVPGENSPPAISTEGFSGLWWKVSYNGRVGYIVSSYLLPAPPPKPGVKTLKAYFDQVSSLISNPLVIKNTDSSLNEMGESVLTKRFYRNGMENQRREGYEYASETSILPDFTIESCFLLLRLLGEYPELVGEKDVFPAKSTTIKKPGGDKIIELEWEKFGMNPEPVKKIKISAEQGVISELEIFILDSQVVIFYSSGV